MPEAKETVLEIDLGALAHNYRYLRAKIDDGLKKGINIGLNERLAYIKHLFGGDTADYNRVLSQLNTFTSLEEASKFIDLVVKPDYNNWQGKEAYEERFRAHIENKFGK